MPSLLPHALVGGLLLAGLPLTADAQRPAGASSSAPMQPYQTERFKLTAGPSAAEGYPMTIQFGAFVRSDGQTLPIPSGHYLDSKGPWDVSSIAWAVGEDTQPPPEQLEILYFSFTENAFYEGKFALPQQRLYQLLKAGFWQPKTSQQVTYSELTVCVLPKGLVVVWLTGPGRQTLVGHYQGHVSDASFARFFPRTDRAQLLRTRQATMSPAVQQQLKAGTISARQWESYLRTYSWQLALPPEVTLTTYRLNYLSGEYTSGPDTRDYAPYVQALGTPQVRAVPTSATLQVRDAAGQAYRLRIRRFDEAETQAAFARLHQAAPTQPLTLRLVADKYLRQAKLELTNGSQTLPLTKTLVEVTAGG